MLSTSQVNSALALRYLKVSALLALSFAAFFIFFEAWWCLVGPVMHSILSAIGFWTYRYNNPRAALLLLILSIWLAPVWCVFFSGGLQSPLLIWLILGPLITIFLLDKWMAILLAACSVSLIGLLGLFQWQVVFPNEFMDESAQQWLAMISGTSAVALATYFGFEVSTRYRQTLKEAEEFKVTLDQMADGVFMFETDSLQFCYVNEAAIEQLGYSRDELYSMTPVDIKPAMDRAYFEEMIEPLGEDGVTHLAFETVHRHKNGHDIPVEILLQHYVLKDDSTRFIATARDISARNRHNKALEMLSVASGDNALDSIATAVCIGLDVRWAGVGRLIGDNLVQVESFCQDGKLEANFQYSLINSPCEIVRDKCSTTIIHSAVSQIFLKDELIVEMGAESYCGEPLYDEGGNISGILWGLHDEEKSGQEMIETLTLFKLAAKRASLELSKRLSEHSLAIKHQFNQALLNGASVGIVSMNTSGVVTTFNPQAEKILGYDASEIIDKQSPALWHDPKDVEAQAKALSEKIGRKIEPGTETFTYYPNQGVIEEYNVDFITKSGARVPVNLSVSAIKSADDHITGYIGMFSDVTDKKNMIAELIEAKEVAESANKAKSGFLANMSHEIRTPMNGVIGLTDVVLTTELKDDQRAYLESVQTSAKSLMVILNEILDFSKIEAGRMTIEATPFEIKSIIEATQELYFATGQSKGVAFVASIDDNVPPFLVGDPTRLGQVLNNLVGNALKFTQEGEVSVQIQLDYRAIDEAIVRFVVTDTGIGISAEQQKHLFDPFSQADNSTTRRYGGTGLGLTICQQLVNLMGGEIGIESTLGEGSQFHYSVLLPIVTELEVEDDVSKQFRMAQEAKLSGVHVLVAEDNTTNQTLIKAILQKLNMTFDVVSDGQQAVDKIKADKNTYQVILMDVHMPVMNGLDAACAITEMSSVPIIALSAATLAHERQACLDVGMVDFVSKPLARNVLVDILVKWAKSQSC
ncbi:MAG: PAS domain S-box protein [Methylococcales bacterium]|jgi:PAS domain S-box-containing protein|nr:PAS domain S-box protein [Methylococcales bacterium]MBT7444336.1 PAS domain S-box protein [Methylococcales bacterium]